MTRKKKGIILFVVILLGAGFTYFFYQNTKNGGRDVSVSGNVEVTTVDVAFKISGKIEKLLVEEGDFVKEGQPIATLEVRDLLAQKTKAQATLEIARSKIPTLLQNIDFQDQATAQEIFQAEAAVDVAKARLLQLQTGSRPQEIKAAKAGVDQASSDLEKRKADRERAKMLFDKKYISAQEWDSARSGYEIALANFQKAQENYTLVVEGPRQEEISQARAQLEQAQAGLLLARSRRLQVEVLKKDLATAQAQVKEAAAAIEVIQAQIEYSHLSAPMAGVILVKNTEPGEFVVPGAAVVTLGDLEKPWLKAFINENDLGRVKLGQKVSVTTDSYPGKVYAGKIIFISSEAEFTPKNVQTAKERVKLVYRIKVSLTNPNFELKPGMPADAKIQVPEGGNG